VRAAPIPALRRLPVRGSRSSTERREAATEATSAIGAVSSTNLIQYGAKGPVETIVSVPR
jgi:hypothetical protein